MHSTQAWCRCQTSCLVTSCCVPYALKTQAPGEPRPGAQPEGATVQARKSLPRHCAQTRKRVTLKPTEFLIVCCHAVRAQEVAQRRVCDLQAVRKGVSCFRGRDLASQPAGAQAQPALSPAVATGQRQQCAVAQGHVIAWRVRPATHTRVLATVSRARPGAEQHHIAEHTGTRTQQASFALP